LARRPLGIAVLVVCLWPTSTWAQVNTEALRPRVVDDGLSLGAELSLGLAKGNVDFLDLGATVRVVYETLRDKTDEPGPRFSSQRVFVMASGRYAERTALGEETAKPYISQTFVHARWTAMWRERFGTEVFAQVQTNEFLRLRSRALGGTGLRIDLVHREGLQLWAGTGTMLEHNRIDVAPGAPDPETELSHRSTSYLAVRAEPRAKSVLFQLTSYLQPAWARPEDLRTLTELETQVKVTDVLALGQALSLLHDTRPPTGVRPTDLRLTASVKVSF